MSTKGLNALGLGLIVAAAGLLAFRNVEWKARRQLLNVSYDPTREVYQEIDAGFAAAWQQQSGERVEIQQSHGGSSRQARAVAEGLAADVVTLALPSDIQRLSRRGLVAEDWPARLPHRAQPYYSTIVFVVRKSNPKHLRDWPDLAAPGIAIVTPDPKTSGNGKLSVLAAWGSVLYGGGSEAQAWELIRKLYANVEVLGQGARDATTRFALEKQGDVHLTWENEALRETQEAQGDLEVVYPPASIRAEPSVAWVDANVAKHRLEPVARAYLSYLFTEPAQESFAKHGYRPIDEKVLARHRDRFPPLALFPVTLVAQDWDDAQTKFFGENGIFEALHPAKAP